MTFFFMFEKEYPYKLINMSPIINFSFSNKLEYCSQIFLYDNNIYLSLGVDDQYSVLLKIKLKTILNLF